MHTVDLFNSKKVSNLIQRIKYLFIFVTLILTFSTCWFAFKWVEAVDKELIYFVTPEGTYCSKKRTHSIRCEDFEIENFTIQFLKNAFEHNEHTYEENLTAALNVMDKKSGLFLKSKYNEEDVFNVYKNYNGVSRVSIDRFEVSMDDYPYEVIVFYTTKMEFLGLEAKKLLGTDSKEIPGGIFFKVKNTHRSRENPYGLCITNFSFVDHKNKDKNVQNNK